MTENSNEQLRLECARLVNGNVDKAYRLWEFVKYGCCPLPLNSSPVPAVQTPVINPNTADDDILL